MRTQKRQDQVQDVVRRWDMPVFWKHFVLMVSILVMAVAVLFIYSSITNKQLRDNYMKEFQSTLDRNSKAMSVQMYLTYSIPDIIESTDTYKYMSRSDVEYKKLVLPLYYAHQQLLNNAALYGENRECLLYFTQTKSIVGRGRIFPDARDCFSGYIHFSEMSTERVIELMQKRNNITILPMQDVSFNNGAMEKVMPLVIFPPQTKTSIMTLYSEKTILNYLGYDSLPEGSCIQILGTEGTLYERCPENVDLERGNWLEVYDKTFEFTVRIWIPDEFFDLFAQNAWRVSWIVIGLMAIIGIAMCFFLSNISSRPIRRLAMTYRGDNHSNTDEVNLLANVLQSSHEEQDRLRGRLTSTLLARAFSGVTLSEHDEAYLVRNASVLSGNYRVAVIHTDAAANEKVKPFLIQRLTDEFRCEVINESETCVLFGGDDESRDLLHKTLCLLQEELTRQEQQMLCGISAVMDHSNAFSIAVRQAYAAMSQSQSIGYFTADIGHRKAVTHLQYERLRQSIQENDEERSLELLESISREAFRDITAQEMFYSIRLTIRRAAEEIGIVLPELNQAQYDQARLPRENIEQLRHAMQNLFVKIRQKQDGGHNDRLENIVEWICENYQDDTLCAASAAAWFGVTPKRVGDMMMELTGMSFSAYLLQLRMHTAAKLLCTTEYVIKDICTMCGYSAESTFYRVFKKYYGVTTSEFRKTGGKTATQNLPVEN